MEPNTDLIINAPGFGISHQITYSEIVDDIGSQIMLRFLIIGVVFLIYSYWNRCGMRKDFKTSGNSICKIIMVSIFKERAEEMTIQANGFLDGLTSSVAIVAIAMWLMYKLGW